MTTSAIVARVFDIAAGASPRRIPRGSRQDLPKVFAAAGFTRGAEIGVWKGGFAEVLCRRTPGLHLLAVDPYESYAAYEEQKNKPSKIAEARRDAERRLAPFAVAFIRQQSIAAAAGVADGSLDFVYIDGNHAEAFVRADLEAWTPKVRRGGIVAGHDYRAYADKPFIQVQPAVDAFTAARHIDPWFVLAGDKSPSFFWVVS